MNQRILNGWLTEWEMTPQKKKKNTCSVRPDGEEVEYVSIHTFHLCDYTWFVWNLTEKKSLKVVLCVGEIPAMDFLSVHLCGCSLWNRTGGGIFGGEHLFLRSVDEEAAVFSFVRVKSVSQRHQLDGLTLWREKWNVNITRSFSFF